MKTHYLKHDDRVRLAGWVIHYAKIGTSAACRAGRTTVDDAGVALFRAIDRGHDMVWCVQTGSALVNDGGAYYAREREIHAAATIVSDGDIAMVDGVRYRIRVVPGNAGEFPRNSDPIKFDLFDTAELHQHLRLWCLAHGIECRSADELLAEAKDYHHRNWLTRFIKRWDAAVAFEDQHGEPRFTESEAYAAVAVWEAVIESRLRRSTDGPMEVYFHRWGVHCVREEFMRFAKVVDAAWHALPEDDRDVGPFDFEFAPFCIEMVNFSTGTFPTIAEIVNAYGEFAKGQRDRHALAVSAGEGR